MKEHHLQSSGIRRRSQNSNDNDMFENIVVSETLVDYVRDKFLEHFLKIQLNQFDESVRGE
jgi:hypothetical protein